MFWFRLAMNSLLKYLNRPANFFFSFLQKFYNFPSEMINYNQGIALDITCIFFCQSNYNIKHNNVFIFINK